MKKYVLVDSHNLFFKSASISQRCPIDLKVGLCLNIFLNSLNSANKIFNPDHFVLCVDSKSWRYDFYEKYKLMRRKKFLEMTPKEKEEYELLMESYKDLIDFFNNGTNLSVLKCDKLEADDLISFWIKIHENDENIILSQDSDFIQLLRNKNTKIYNSNKNIIINQSGCFDLKNRIVNFYIDSKGKICFREKEKKLSEKSLNKFVNDSNKSDSEKYWYEWALFLKIMRGDLSDGIESVLPNVRKKILLEAFNDRIKKGFDWNKLMYQEISDGEKKIRVIDRYKFNKMLIDLESQPDEIKKLGFSYIENIGSKKNNKNIGFSFLKFCNKYGLKRIEQNQIHYINFLVKSYEKN